MNLEAILALMKEMETSGIESLEWEAAGDSLRLTRPVQAQAAWNLGSFAAAAGANAAAAKDDAANTGNVNAAAAANAASAANQANASGQGAISGTDTTTVAEATAEPAGRLITSPVVGVFYASPAPDQDPFVSQGSVVTAGAPLGIIEAMKLMNEVTSPADGTVTEILIENGQRVEYGQPLFRIEENEA